MVWFFICEMSRKGKSLGIESKLMVVWAWGWEQGLSINNHEGSFWVNGKEWSKTGLQWSMSHLVNLLIYWTVHLSTEFYSL